MKGYCYLITLLIICLSFSKGKFSADYEVVPLPQEITYLRQSGFILNQFTKITFEKGDSLLERNAHFLRDYIKELAGISLEITHDKQDTNNIALKSSLQNEVNDSYEISISDKQIVINGAGLSGTFYGIQTLRKSMLPGSNGKTVFFPSVKIKDFPRFSYRGMMLDVGRHFFSVSEVKELIDLMALHNMNHFHWHLTEDQGWRVEIEKYPKLTTIGSTRKDTKINHNTGEFEETGKMYGPFFYTKNEIRDVVAYAQKRYIEIIPEIDLPGHMLAAIASYPELGCTGGPYEIAVKRGVYDDVLCIGKEQTFNFVKDVLSEIIELFPYEYVHIGGDECHKVRWKACSHCQQKAKELNLNADKYHSVEDQLQSYFISRIEKFLNSKGKQIIGWDEILEGGLAPNATVMSWRGIEGGIAAAQMKHKVIMSPSQFLYFDYYQSRDVTKEPFTIGNYLPLKKVYDYEPQPNELTDEEKKYIWGIQGNLWTEYIKTRENLQYMMLPRMDALAEIQWTLSENKDYQNFLKRFKKMQYYYDKNGLIYSKSFLDAEILTKPDSDKASLWVEMSTPDNAPLFYTLDGSTPTTKSEKYTGQFRVSQSSELKVLAYRGDGQDNKIQTKVININKATFKSITLKHRPSSRFTFEGENVLIDGILGNTNYTDGTWIGFHGKPLDAVINLGDVKTVSELVTAVYLRLDNRVFGPAEIKIELSLDGESYVEVFSKKYNVSPQGSLIGRSEMKCQFTATDAKYVRIIIRGTDKIPQWHISRGGTPLLFIDEFILN